ncbi:NnrS family protein [Aquabacterium sp. A7-Y]|uniref:NnrS family protein n=1 Tax=Aquabacterium sp. A7-Y TaxID=1349605 RepID=UPI00223DC2A4|nr:NnrS family protein [Aquabacterium sp. A7-Y]MCW7540728.1 NnrS family protein [Aquabacterium sp. A7-Y]
MKGASGRAKALPASAAPWRFRWLLAAPHRLAFFAAAVVLAGSAVWWAAVVVLQAQGQGLTWAVPAAAAHGLLMGYGFLPLFFAGFLFTAGPKWLGQPPVEAGTMLRPVLGCLAGWVVFLAGVHLDGQLAALGTALATAGFAMMTARFVRMLRDSAAQDTRHAELLAVGCVAGLGVQGLATLGLAAGDLLLVRAAVHGGLWSSAALVFVTAIHRMVPFFTAAAMPRLDAWRPMWLLWVLCVAVAVQGPLTMAEGLWGALPAWARMARLGVEVPVALLLLRLAVRWGQVQNLGMRLIAMLHLGFVWLGLAFALNALSHALVAAGGEGWSLGLAPTHALTIGFFGSTFLVMVTRVSCAHGGRALVADDLVWRLFWLLQLAAAARVGAALWPASATGLMVVAALAWAACMAAWSLRHVRWYGRPRPDGRPG